MQNSCFNDLDTFYGYKRIEVEWQEYGPNCKFYTWYNANPKQNLFALLGFESIARKWSFFKTNVSYMTTPIIIFKS